MPGARRALTGLGVRAAALPLPHVHGNGLLTLLSPYFLDISSCREAAAMGLRWSQCPVYPGQQTSPPPFAVCLLIIGPACPRPATQPSQQRSLGEQATLGTQAGPGLWGWLLSAQVSSRGCLLFRVSCPPRDACRVTGVRLGTQGHKKDAHGGTARPPVTHKMPTSPQGAGRCHSRCTTPGSEGAFIHDASHPSCLFLVPEAWQGLSQEPRAVWSSCMGASPRGTALPRIEGRIRVQEAPLRVGGSGWAVSPCAQDLGRSQGLHWCPELLRTPPPHLLLLQGPVCPAGSHCHVFLPRRRTATGDGRSA